MRLLVTTVVVLTLLYPSSGLTQTICGPQDYDAEEAPDFGCPGPGEAGLTPDLDPPASVPVHQGQEVVAEWDGALVHRDRLLEVGLTIKAVRRLRWADRLRIHEEYAIRMRYEQRVAEARLTFAEQQRDAYQEQARAAEARAQSSSAWWRSPALWFTIGILTAGAMVALTAYGLSAVD